MHEGTRAVTWSVAAERKQQRSHPAHVDRYIAPDPAGFGRMLCTRECESCGRIYRYFSVLEIGGPDSRGVMTGLCGRTPECNY